MEETISFFNGVVEVKPFNNGTFVFKQHHFKYCECSRGEVWTGDGKTGCRAKFEFIKKEGDKEFFRCRKSGLKIILLKSTERELKLPDKMGSKFIKLPAKSKLL